MARITVCIAVFLAAAVCHRASVPPVAAGGAARRVVAPEDFGRSATVRIGDEIVVRPPMNAAEWQVMYEEAFLGYAGTRESLRAPGADGWTFTAKRAGETALTVTPVSRGGANPPRFTVTLRIEP